MNSVWRNLLICSLLSVKFVSSQQTDGACYNRNAKRGKCVHIDQCPKLHKLAYSPTISEADRIMIKTSHCGKFQSVCCLEPLAPMVRNVAVVVASTKQPPATRPVSTSMFPDESICGIDDTPIRNQTGQYAELNQFRWVVAIEHNIDGRLQFKCGGTIIHREYVLTAASCVKVKAQQINLWLGDWDLHRNPDCDKCNSCNANVLLLNVSKIIPHPDSNGIALLKLGDSLPEQYTPNISPICLPFSEALLNDALLSQNFTFVGWGHIEKRRSSRFKMYTVLQTTDCSVGIRNSGNNEDSKNICTKWVSRNFCPRNAGSPLMIKLFGHWYLIGFSGVDNTCGTTHSPGNFTRIFNSLHWIKTTLDPEVASYTTMKPSKVSKEASTIPNEKICGMDKIGFRIFGGQNTKLDQFRWMVAIERINDGIAKYQCGGSLINTQYVLTAAHCVKSVDREEQIVLRLGEWDLKRNNDCDKSGNCNEPVLISRVSKIIRHPDYINRTHDIALLKLAKALPEEYSENIAPICLPFSESLLKDAFTNQSVTVAGWGRWGSGPHQDVSRYKKYTNLQTTSCEEARKHFRNLKLASNLRQEYICAKSPSKASKTNSCHGDSGGPLMTNIDGNWYLIGIINSGSLCGRTHVAGISTRVTNYADWIMQNIND